MMNRKRLSRGVLTVMAVVTMVGCSRSHDLFDESGHEQQQKNDYATNFVKKYGAVDPEQTWDFAHMYPTYSLSGSASQVRGATRAVVNADNSYTTIGDWYSIISSSVPSDSASVPFMVTSVIPKATKFMASTSAIIRASSTGRR